MLARLVSGSTWSGDIQVETVAWRSAQQRQYGEASLFVPRAHPACDDRYINPLGGFLVEVNGGALGMWRGLAQSVRPSWAGVEISAMCIDWIASRVPVAPRRTFEGMTAGQIVRQAVYDALGVIAKGGLTAGSFVECGPLVPRYEFTGQPLEQVLTDMQEWTGSEWRFADDGEFSFRPPVASLYPRVLCEGGDLTDVQVEAMVDDRLAAAEAVMQGDGRSFTARAGEVAGDSYAGLRETLDVDTDSMAALKLAADALLAARRWPMPLITARLRPGPRSGQVSLSEADAVARGLGGESAVTPHWAGVREGDFVRVALTSGAVPVSVSTGESGDEVPRGLGAGGATSRRSGTLALCRVLSRTYAERDGTLTVELQQMRPYEAATVAAARERVTPSYAPPAVNDVVALLRRAG